MSWRTAEDYDNAMDQLERDFPVGSEVRIDGQVGTVTGHKQMSGIPYVLVQFQGQSVSRPVGRRGLVRSKPSYTKDDIGGRRTRTRRAKRRMTRKRKGSRKA